MTPFNNISGPAAPQGPPPLAPDPPEVTADQPERKPIHLDLSAAEESLLKNRVEQDFNDALVDHQTRMSRYQRYYLLWRSRLGGSGGAVGKSNFKVPLVAWNVLSKLANIADAIFGDDAEIIAEPIGPSDQDTSPKVGKYMTWLFFKGMHAKSELLTFLFRVLMFGRAHVYLPYVRETYEDADGSEAVDYEGPAFIPLWPDDIILPAEDFKNLHKASFVIRRYWETADDLLRGEEEGRYKKGSVTENFAKIYGAAESAAQRDGQADQTKKRKDQAEGVLYESSASRKGALEIQEWYGRHRMLKGKEDAPADDFTRREMRETELVVTRIKDCDCPPLSVRKLVEMYPKMKDRRPFDEMPLMDTGEYWSKSYPEMLEDIELELTTNNNLVTEGGEMTVGPILAHRPAVGQKLRQSRWQPRMLLEVENPTTDVAFHQPKIDMTYAITQEQKLVGYGERLTGQSDSTMGRAIDRPNAPRTARGQAMLLEQGSIRQNLDNLTLKEHLSRILSRIWLLDSLFGPPSVFFRVTEADAKGLFDVKSGFGEMTAGERGGKFDFNVKFATSALSREAEKEKVANLVGMALPTPLIANNLEAQWNLLDMVFEQNGKDFRSIAPKPPTMDLPLEPAEEWNLALQGAEFSVHPMDQDELHIAEHQAQVGEAGQARNPDKDAINRMIAHIMKHEEQKKNKLAFAMQVQAQAQLAEAVSSMGGLDGNEGAPPMMPPAQDPMAALSGGGVPQ